jgi:tetratricopeptide (TPR) repeat protein/transcriptional regulator with XRE-family HTH domain
MTAMSQGQGFGEVVRTHRRRLGLTQEELAEKSGLSVRTIGKIEAGRIAAPRPPTVRLLAEVFELANDDWDRFCQSAVGPATDQPARAVMPAQLPPDLPGFTGRDTHLRLLDDLLPGVDDKAGGSVVLSTIAGAPGVGKTALAVRWGHRVRRSFPDGQLYVNLRGYASIPPLRPIDALVGFLSALGTPMEQIPVDLDRAAALYRSLVADKRVLVVLDNARDAEQVRPLLPASTGCLVLVTSRDRLSGLIARDGARRIDLDVLSAHEGRLLLSAVLGADRVAAEPTATAALAEACCWLPLALRIAAANLNDHPNRRLSGYVAELRGGNRLAALAIDGDEQAAVRAAFDLSYAALPPPARQLFRLLGLVPGLDVTVDSAAALAALTAERAAELLDRLASVHLLTEHAPGRYTFHDLLRRYAADRAATEEGDERRIDAVRRLYAFDLHTVYAAVDVLKPGGLRLPHDAPPKGVEPSRFADRDEVIAWLDAERSNLVAAVTVAAEHGPRREAYLLADALRGYFWARALVVDWLAVANAGLIAAVAEGDQRAQASAELSLGDCRARFGEYREAIAHGTRALALARRTGWQEAEAAALNNLGIAYSRAGRLPAASRHFSRALAVKRRTGSVSAQASSLVNLGTVFCEMGQLERAADHAMEAALIYRESGSSQGECFALGNLGAAYLAQGRLADAKAQLDRAVRLSREFSNPDSETETIRLLADVHAHAGNLDLALELANTALEIAQGIDDRQFEPHAWNVLGDIARRRSRPAVAVEHHRRALQLGRQNEIRFAQVIAEIGTAYAAVDLGQLDLACARSADALIQARDARYRLLEGRAMTALATVHLAARDIDAAMRWAHAAIAVHRETGHRPGEADTLLVLGHALHQTGDLTLGREQWQEAVTLYSSIGSADAGAVQRLLRSS